MIFGILARSISPKAYLLNSCLMSEAMLLSYSGFLFGRCSTGLDLYEIQLLLPKFF